MCDDNCAASERCIHRAAFYESLTRLNDDDCRNSLQNQPHMILDMLKDKNCNKTMKYIIEKKLDPNSIFFNTLLTASDVANDEIIGELIKRGDDINCQCFHGFTPLMHAIVPEHYEKTYNKTRSDTAKCLIDAGANLDLQTKDGFTALMFSVFKLRDMDSSVICEYLINAGANLDLKDLDDCTAAIHLSKYCNSASDNADLSFKTLKYLVDHGANLDIKNKKRKTIFTIMDSFYRKELIFYINFPHFMKHYLIREKGHGPMNKAFGVWHIMHLSLLFCKPY